MRAFISCTSQVDKNKLETILTEKNWLPTMAQSASNVQRMRDEIIAQISPEDKEITTEDQVWFTIYDTATRSWGIVNSPVHGKFVFRIRNSTPEKLQRASERLIADLSMSRGSHFRFDTRIDVLQINSGQHAYHGNILPGNWIGRIWRAIDDRRVDATVGLIAGALAIGLLVITFPTIEPSLLTSLSINDLNWQKWWDGIFSRLGTSAIVTATVTWSGILVHYLRIRRKAIVDWIAD